MLAGCLLFGPACAFHARSTLPRPPTPRELAELVEPGLPSPTRDLFYGPGGPGLAPQEDDVWTHVEAANRGASPKLTVKDRRGRVWETKMGPEARTEVVASRLAWAIGFHQPPAYYVAHWTTKQGGDLVQRPPARFRPRLDGLKKVGDWKWSANPFVGTRELKGLFVFMVMINNWDLKTQQNPIYERAGAQTSRLYVVRDLGASFGATRWFIPGTKGRAADFSSEPFILGVKGEKVEFAYRGGWREPHLNDDITVADVVWVCRRLDRLTDRQWVDAFRAGGFDELEAEPFIQTLKEKVRQGLALQREVRQ
jgi:hypothetical protein